MKIELNIGLKGTTQQAAQAAVMDLDWPVQGMRTQTVKHAKGTERTLIVAMTGPGAAGVGVYHLAHRLNQDCIAVHYPDLGKGELIGPKASEWGAFNPEYFIRF